MGVDNLDWRISIILCNNNDNDNAYNRINHPMKKLKELQTRAVISPAGGRIIYKI